ncbi:head GIN domain-containing protein [Paraburkholderia fungorum]|uniref:Putative auto-transporter adhesin head GIN domain-containing protein n=1 Tax=Paraburkholderia fungorum TaxID=134537 RepID=A0AAW3V173_9BURK|nr:head GIN domain-containing protein [Paraburkholderia fungorum]MBB4517231.1 hypothetical protein [Paraburkholderia fungorum]MBB6204299.1 hypothetical protein [Paraburkholderia fungorum]
MKKYPFLRIFSAAVIAICIGGQAFASTSVVVDGHGNIVRSSTDYGNSNVVIIDGKVVSGSGSKPARGPIKTEQRDLQPFSVVELEAPSDATFAIAPKASISITGPADALAKVSTSVSNGRLKVSINDSISLAAPLRVQISGPSLSGVRLPGSGTIKLDIPAGNALDLRISGSGTIRAAGKISTLRIQLSGAGMIDAAGLQAKTVDAELSGSGDIRAWATERADVDLSGSGDLSIRGKPAVRNVDRSGAGDVKFD